MKITKEHFDKMMAACKATKDMWPEFTPEYYQRYNIGKDPHKRFRWALWGASKVDDHPAITWQCGHLYPYVDDSHIDTALRNIVMELYKP